MDATHSITVYDFLVITILVVEDFSKGVPIALAISYREGTAVLI